MASQVSQPLQWHYTELDDHIFHIRGRTLFLIVVLFAVVFLVTLFFLYTRWFCRFALFSDPSTASDVAPAPSINLTQGLDPTAIDTLPIILHRSKSTRDDNQECCICLGIFEEGDEVKILPMCQHCYHCECVDTWLRTRSSCPLCRSALRVDSVLPCNGTQ